MNGILERPPADSDKTQSFCPLGIK